MVLGGHADVALNFPSTFVLDLQAGNIRALAMNGIERWTFPVLKDIPTMLELGYDVRTYTFTSIYAPKRTPKPVLRKLFIVFKQICEDKEFKVMMDGLWNTIAFLGGEDFAKYAKEQEQYLAGLLKSIYKE